MALARRLATTASRWLRSCPRTIAPCRWLASDAAEPDDGSTPPGVRELLRRYQDVPIEQIRNFSIIAHVDHGKSTLADRILELSGNIYRPGEGPQRKYALGPVANEQVLDSLKVERERGITVKAQTASLLYTPKAGHQAGKTFLLNLIDTPGHVDFAYEVSRSLAACQGALLLVDVGQGVQAQTVANHSAARSAGLELVPVLTKIDIPHADPEPALEQIRTVLKLSPEDTVWTSGKSGIGISDALDAVVARLPPPKGRHDEPTRALLFDSWYDEFRGVICVVQVIDGLLEKGDKILTTHGGGTYVVSELGLLTPGRFPVGTLAAGQVGYVVTGMKDPRDARIGDTIVVSSGRGSPHATGKPAPPPLPGFAPSKPMVFASIFPVDTSDFEELRSAVERLSLTDASVTLTKENSSSLGFGYRCGFLGLLHMDVFFQRLQDEHDMPVIATAPTVPYIVETEDGVRMAVERPDDFPENHLIRRVFEPMVRASIITPNDSVSAVLSLMQEHRAEQEEMTYLDDGRVLLKYCMPWQEVVTNFFDKLKSVTAGYATFDYEPAGDQQGDVVKVDIWLNGNPVDSLSFIAHRQGAETQGRRVAQKLRSVIRRQQFEIVIQAAVGRKVFVRERIPPFRKDVLQRSGKTVGGGDLTRKRKLLEKQKKGKARMRSVGNVQLTQEAFHAVLQR
jgi:elongation factor 4